MDSPSSTTAFQDSLAALAKQHSLVVVEELGISGPCYRVMDRTDADLYMALVYGHTPERLH